MNFVNEHVGKATMKNYKYSVKNLSIDAVVPVTLQHASMCFLNKKVKKLSFLKNPNKTICMIVVYLYCYIIYVSALLVPATPLVRFKI